MATPGQNSIRDVKTAVKGAGLVTVCEEASCPNLGHCWGLGTATFMIMGDRCTRRCGFCDINTGKPFALDPAEPINLAKTVASMKLKHVVITSVDRDDLKDAGSMHFGRSIAEVKKLNPETTTEVLIPDFKGKPELLENVWREKPTIINHNVETVPSLFKKICPQSNYQVSIDVLRLSSERGFLTKSGIILGLGETLEEVRQVIDDLYAAGVHLLTIGQYLQPTREHAPLESFFPVEVFDELKEYAIGLGFLHVESGPLVRSSYHAGESLNQILEKKKAH